MLIHHFGSKPGLWVEVIRAVEQRQREVLAEIVPDPALAPADAIRDWWRHISDPALWPNERLFFEVYGQALQGRPGTTELLDGIVEDWLGPGHRVRPRPRPAARRGARERPARRGGHARAPARPPRHGRPGGGRRGDGRLHSAVLRVAAGDDSRPLDRARRRRSTRRGARAARGSSRAGWPRTSACPACIRAGCRPTPARASAGRCWRSRPCCAGARGPLARHRPGARTRRARRRRSATAGRCCRPSRTGRRRAARRSRRSCSGARSARSACPRRARGPRPGATRGRPARRPA